MGTLSGEVTHFHICFPHQEGFTLTGKKLPLEKFFFLKGKPHLGRTMSAKEANRKSLKLFSLVIIGAKHGGISINLEVNVFLPYFYKRRHLMCPVCFPGW